MHYPNLHTHFDWHAPGKTISNDPIDLLSLIGHAHGFLILTGHNDILSTVMELAELLSGIHKLHVCREQDQLHS